MAISSNDIQEQGFGTSRNGYDMQEVDVFLEYISNEIDFLNNENQELKNKTANSVDANELAQAQSELRTAKDKIKNLEIRLADKNEDKDAIAEALIIAQRSADSIRKDAIEEAERIIKDAEDKGAELIREAKAERGRVIEDIDRLNDSRSDFAEEYLVLLQRYAKDAELDFRKLDLDPAPAAIDVSKGKFPNTDVSQSFRGRSDIADKPSSQAQRMQSVQSAPSAPVISEPKATNVTSFAYGEVDDTEIDDVE